MRFRFWICSLFVIFGTHCSDKIWECPLSLGLKFGCNREPAPLQEPKVLRDQIPQAQFFTESNLEQLVLRSADNKIRLWDVGDSDLPKVQGIYLSSVFVSEETSLYNPELLTTDLSGITTLWFWSVAGVWKESVTLSRQDSTKIVAAAHRSDQTILTVDEQYRVVSYDHAGNIVNQFALTSGSAQSLHSLDDAVIGFPDGLLIARSGEEVRIWKLDSNLPNQLLPEKYASVIHYIPEEKEIVTVARSMPEGSWNVAKIWRQNPEGFWTVEREYFLPEEGNITATLYIPASSTYDKSFMLATDQGKVYLFDWASLSFITSFSAFQTPIVSLALSSQRKLFAAVSSDPQEKVKVWALPIPDQGHLFPDQGLAFPTRNIRFSANGNYLIRVGDDVASRVSVSVWEVTKAAVHQIQSPIKEFEYDVGGGTILYFSFGQIFTTAVSDDGRRALVYFRDGNSGRAMSCVFDVQSTGLQVRWLVPDTIGATAISRDGKRMAATTYEAGVYATFIYDLEVKGAYVGSIQHAQYFSSFTFSGDDQWLVTTEAISPMPGRYALYATVYDLTQLPTSVKIPSWLVDDNFRISSGQLLESVVTDNGGIFTLAYLQVSSNNPIIRRWDITSMVPKLLVRVSESPRFSFSRTPPVTAISPSGDSVATIESSEPWVNIWDIAGIRPQLSSALGYIRGHAVAASLVSNDIFQTVTKDMIVTRWDLKVPIPRWELRLQN